MAGGIDWFRWHHGTVNDPKFQLVARRSGASVAEVVAVWAMLLEAASAAQDRGNVGVQDFEAIDCALGMEDGRAASIYAQMQARGLVDDGGNLPKWSERQPSRERESDNSAERVRRHRERKRQAEAEEPVTPVNPVTTVTPCNASNGQETPRGEESREDKSSTPDRSLRAERSLRARAQTAGSDDGEPACPGLPPAAPQPSAPLDPTAAGRACLAMRRGGLAQTNPGDPRLAAAIAEGATDAMWQATAAEACGHDPPKGVAWVIATVRGRIADAACQPNTTGVTHGAHRSQPRLSAVDRVVANIQRARQLDQQRGNDGGDDAIPGEAVRIPR